MKRCDRASGKAVAMARFSRASCHPGRVSWSCEGQSLDEAILLAEHVAVVTHTHSEGMKGASTTAAAVSLARSEVAPSAIRQKIAVRFAYHLSAPRLADESECPWTR